MREDIAKKWVEALRSGKYKQGHNLLYSKTTDSYCCLGVLQGPVLGLSVPTSSNLSEEAIEVSGMQTGGGGFTDNNKTSLWMLNDIQKLSFNSIANVIEANWKDL